MDDRFMPNIALKAKVKILSIDYSLAPEAMFPVALNERDAVVKYAKEHSTELGIDPENMGVGGHSAGGNLCAAICLLDAQRRELGLKVLILDYPPLDIHKDPIRSPGRRRRRPGGCPVCLTWPMPAAGRGAKNPLISPFYATVDQVKLFPPTLVITASEDSLAAEAEAFKDKSDRGRSAVNFQTLRRRAARLHPPRRVGG